MLITFADVVSRYLFNWPLRGAFEATELMLLVLIFAGLPLVSHADEHVTMDFIDRMLTPRATAALVRVVHALCAAVMFFLAWQVWIKATRIAGYGDTTDVLRIPVGPFVYLMALMIGLTGAGHVLRPGDGDHPRLRGVRRDLRLLDRHRGDLRQGGVSVDEEVRLCRLPVHRRDRGRRHARHPDPALHHHGDLRHHDRDQHRQAVRRRHPAGSPGDSPVVPRGAIHHLARSQGRTAGRADELARALCHARGAVGVRDRRRGDLNWETLYASLVESARTTSMLFLILIGALMFAEFVNITTMPGELRDLVRRFELHPILVVAAIMTIYVILGTAMEELSMILLTVPVFFPLVVHLGLDPVWFGILIVVVVEIGLISPPVGMNLFVLNTLLPQVPTRTIFRGVLPFMAADCVRLAILVAFPIISTYLPSMMK